MLTRPVAEINGSDGEEYLKPLGDLAKKMGSPVVRTADKARKLYDAASTDAEKKMKQTANEFVSLLYQMLFKEMEKTIPKTGLLDGGTFEETFKPMVMQEYAKSASTQQNNNLAHRLYETLYDATKRRVDPETKDAPAPFSAEG